MKKHAVRLTGCLFAAGVLFLLLVCSATAFGAPRRVLVVTVTKGFRHESIPTAERVLGEISKKSGAFTVDYVRTDEEMAKKMTATALQDYAAAVFASTTGGLPLPDKAAFLKWIQSGKGFVGIHAANDTFREHKPLDPYIMMLGGEFKSHGPQVDVEVINQDQRHPACKHYAPTFHVFDEIYLMNGFQRSRVRGLLTLDKHPNTGAPGDYPVAWCRMHGKARVFYTSLGHREEVWENPDYQQHILGGIRWALGLVRTAADPQDTKAGLSVSEAGQGFKLLFNGVNLTGWKLHDPAGRQSWSAQNGMLVNEMSETEPGNDLVTADSFRDFTLRYEYMIPKGAGSGVFLRGRHEIQIADDFEKGQPDIGGNGALYNIAPPARFASRRPGQWQQVEVTLQGNLVTVFLNRVKVLQNVLADRLTGNELDANPNEPGSGRAEKVFLEFSAVPCRIPPTILTTIKMNKHQTELGQPELTRRDFIAGSSFATLMTMLGGVELVAQTAPEKAEEKPPGPKIKCAVIGLGPWGREIIGTLLRQPQAELAVICDNYAASVKRAANAAPNAKTTEDYMTILADKEITAVFIATPSHLHKEIALAALEAGKHVYCEAPLATTVEDTRAIAQAAKAAVKQVFQPGLQMRSDPHLHFLLPFVRSGAAGKIAMARAQWHKKQSWRFTSPNPDRETALNWRLKQETSPGLIGEIGIQQLDQAAWFLNVRPMSVTGYGSIMRVEKDDRDVADTVQAVVEFPEGVRWSYDCTLANSFDSQYEIYYGSDAAILVRENKAWMFKEVDSPLLGWEVYARKDSFYKETGIALAAGASKLAAQGDKPVDADAYPETQLFYAMQSFLGNCTETTAAVEDYSSTFDPNDKEALAKYLATITKRPAATYQDGLEATITAIKANEAIVKGAKITLQKEWFELA